MTLEDKDKANIEEHLRKFQPIVAPPLDVLSRERSSAVRKFGIALAAGLAVVVAVAIMSRTLPPRVRPAARHTKSGQALTVMQFKLASHDDNTLDETLLQAARRAFVSTDNPNTALNTLSKE
ncbi:MAG: hypothetical protein AB7O65_09525 [Candidatus Korobacteraceae bacterium]